MRRKWGRREGNGEEERRESSTRGNEEKEKKIGEEEDVSLTIGSLSWKLNINPN